MQGESARLRTELSAPHDNGRMIRREETELLTGFAATLAWEKGAAEEATGQASKLSEVQ